MKREYSAGAIIYKNGREGMRFLFLIKEGGDCDVPKGHIEKGEGSESAALREVKEETGLSISLIRHFSVWTSYFFRQEGETIFKKVHFFAARARSTKIRISYEHKGYAWLGLRDALKRIRYDDLKEVIEKAYSYISRYEAMERLNNEYAKIPKALGSWSLSCRFVPGEGPLDAQIMLIGQAPGRFEDARLRPFVGRSGMLLDSLLGSAGIRRESAYITSVVQFFPPENRMPTQKEINACLPFLKRQIEIIKPEVLLLMGNVASGAVAGISNVQKSHGTIAERLGSKCLITFHPAAALRFRSTKELMEGDMKLLMGLMPRFQPAKHTKKRGRVGI